MKLARLVLAAAVVLGAAAPAAQALHPGDVGRVQNMFYRTSRVTSRIRHHAERASHRFTWWEREMLASLYEVESSAAVLADVLPQWFHRRWYVEQRYNHLLAHARRVEAHIFRSHWMNPTIYDWQRVAGLINEIHHYLYYTRGAGPMAAGAERQQLFEALHRDPAAE